MCKICDHPQRTAIDRAIIGGDSCRTIASCFATSKDAVQRHKNRCMKSLIAAVPAPIATPLYQTAKDVEIVKQTTTTVLQRVSSLIDVLERQASECSSDKDRRNMTGTAGALLKALELNARLTGELLPGNNQVNVQVNTAPSITTAPEWRIFLQIVDNHPDVKAELVEALRGVRVISEVKNE